MLLLRLFTSFAILASAGAVLTGCGQNAQGPSATAMGAPPEIKVRLETVAKRDINDSTSFMGTLKSRHCSVLQPRVAGVVTRIFVSPGTFVQAGTPLVEIDPEKQIATVNSLAAAAESNEADHESAIQTLHSLEASLISKQSTLNFASTQEKRYKLLAQEGAVASESAERFHNERRVAEGDVKSIKAQIEAQKAAIAKMEKVEKQTHATEAEQRVQLDYYTIKAPFSGVVGDIPIKIGEYLNSESKVTNVTENQPLEVYVNVPAEKAMGLRLGMPVQLMDSNNKLLGEAKVIFIAPSVDDQTQSVLVKALYLNVDGVLRSNQTVGARIVWSRQPRLLVPTFAVAHISGQDFVFVAEKSPKGLVARQKAVDLGEIFSNSYMVKTGLKNDDEIIVSGVQNLTDGAAIAPQTAVSGR